MLLAGIAVVACGPVVGQNNNNGSRRDGMVGDCNVGDIVCQGQTAMICNSYGEWDEQPCDSACVEGQGCVDCVPGSTYCEEDWVMLCNDDQELVQDHQCPESQTCILGECASKCDDRVLTASNVGCEFWAVDLDNEVSNMMGVSNDAAAEQFGIAVANTNDFAVQVDVYINTARVGDTVSESLVTSVNVPAQDLVRIDLPQREVDGCMGQNGTYAPNTGSGTFVSPHAFKVVSNGPVVVYQFNPIVQKYSNDASILIPIQALGKQYYIIGYPTANPCGDTMFPMDSIPDHTSVTIVGVSEGTHVTVYPTHPIMASAGDSGFAIAETDAGGVLDFDIGPYDVVNLESLQFIGATMDCIGAIQGGQDGDFTGTKIVANQPVVVFSSGERGLAGGEAPPPPNFDESCCTDHLEQQMFPITALGWNFAISRSPVRSTTGYKEWDIYRVLATQNNTVIDTSLADFPQFTLNEGESATFWANTGFTVESQGGAIMLGQILVSQGYTDGGNGDSTFTIFPAVDQHREQYVFLILDTFDDNYMVLAMPDTAGISIDGEPQGEFPQGCSIDPIGHISGTDYVQMTCLMEPGVHTVEGTEPVGLTVYGYYNVGSYGYPGGSDVKIINPVE